MTFDPRALVRDYGDAAAEARTCRSAAALFDFSFMAGARITGNGALDALRHLTRRRLDDLAPGRIRYAVRTDADGRLRSDLTVWRHDAESFELMSGEEQDIAELARAAAPGRVTAWGDTMAVLAVQGPRCLRALSAVLDARKIAGLPYYGFSRLPVAGVPALVGRLGYTGEPGFEIVLPRKAAAAAWQALAAHAQPAGFAAADILRIEAGFVLFANEFRLPVSASEAGLEPFAGDTPPTHGALTLVSFTATADFTPVLWQPGVNLARPSEPDHIAVTSACFSPHSGGILGLGYILQSNIKPGRRITDPRGIYRDISLVPRSWIDPAKTRIHASLHL